MRLWLIDRRHESESHKRRAAMIARPCTASAKNSPFPASHRSFTLPTEPYSPLLTNTTNRMTIQIIGAGHHRTGTMSLRNALEQLGFPCHHSIDISRPYTENHPEATGAIG